MDAAIKAEWIFRLRSGKYTQTTGYLKRNGGHCCLGVLCEIAAEQNVIKEENNMMDDIRFSSFDGDNGMPSDKVCNWSCIAPRDAEKLAQLNDDGSTFDQIADEIERDF